MATVTSTFIHSLQTAPHEFVQPSLPLYTDAVAYLKSILDPLAKEVSQEQQERLIEARKKRKRGQSLSDEKVLRLKQIHTDDFGIEQVWEQAKRVIDAATEEAERSYEQARLLQDKESQDLSSSQSEHGDLDSDLGEEGVDYEVEGVDDASTEFNDDDDDDDEDLEDQIIEDDEDFDINGHDDYDDTEVDDDGAGDNEPETEFVADKFGLNDGFFSIDDFNKQSEFHEQQDARGENDGAASDEEEVDWDADPTAQAVAVAQSNAGGEEGESADDEDGPTFGDPDAPSDDDDEGLGEAELDTMGGIGHTNDIMYADFFAPPAQKKNKNKNKKGRPNPHNFPKASLKKNEQVDGEDMERTMAAVHRDLFDESEEEDDNDQEKLDPSDPRSRRSTHERRKAEIQAEIRKLEAANVAKREWTLSGEARAADRPVNSLLEEDLDFERAGKPVPVITAEVSESIEELIKRRILAHDFQTVIRRRPDDLITGKDGKRGRLDFDLDDSKSKKGLAEEYEEEHLRRTDPNFVDVKDEKLKQDQKEIENLWKEVCGQLDSLSSWHFRPKQPVAQMDIRVDAPAVTMEDARPTAGGEVAGASQLAPQELYKAGEVVDKRQEVVGKSGLPAAREELSREERKRRRRREKERIRKAGSNEGAKIESRATKEKKDVLGDLKRGKVKVIGKKGTVTDVEGKNVRGNDSGQGAARLKL